MVDTNGRRLCPQTLNNLYALYGEEKYRASIYLKQYVAKTQNIATQYSRDMTEFA